MGGDQRMEQEKDHPSLPGIFVTIALDTCRCKAWKSGMAGQEMQRAFPLSRPALVQGWAS
jgi:hypothetical protein